MFVMRNFYQSQGFIDVEQSRSFIQLQKITKNIGNSLYSLKGHFLIIEWPFRSLWTGFGPGPAVSLVTRNEPISSYEPSQRKIALWEIQPVLQPIRPTGMSGRRRTRSLQNPSSGWDSPAHRLVPGPGPWQRPRLIQWSSWFVTVVSGSPWEI